MLFYKKLFFYAQKTTNLKSNPASSGNSPVTRPVSTELSTGSVDGFSAITVSSNKAQSSNIKRHNRALATASARSL